LILLNVVAHFGAPFMPLRFQYVIMTSWLRQWVKVLVRWARHPLSPLLGSLLAFSATLTAVAFVPALCPLAIARGRKWGMLVLCCAIGSALGATLLAWLFAAYGPQYVEMVLPRAAHAQTWETAMRWVDDFGFFALIAVAALPLSQTPLLIVCALLGMPLPAIFWSIFAGKLAKYSVSAKLAVSAATHFSEHDARPAEPMEKCS
jgi:membrane protein YqaA with SNARE-associated domain